MIKENNGNTSDGTPLGDRSHPGKQLKQKQTTVQQPQPQPGHEVDSAESKLAGIYCLKCAVYNQKLRLESVTKERSSQQQVSLSFPRCWILQAKTSEQLNEIIFKALKEIMTV